MDNGRDDYVYRSLRHRILSRELLPGERLNEVELAESLNMSRTPVREALARLTNYGLVTTAPRRGASVRRLSHQDVVDLLDMREALECLAVRLATPRLQAEQIAALRDHLLLRRTEALAGQPRNDEPFGEHDLHASLVTASGNALLVDTIQRTYDLLLTLRIGSTQVPGRAVGAVDEHLWVLDALEAHDPELAEERLIAHLRAGRKNILANLPWPDRERSA